MTEHRRPRWAPRGEPSPSNEELFRDVKPVRSVEELFPGYDMFGSDEEHAEFLEWLYEMRRRG